MHFFKFLVTLPLAYGAAQDGPEPSKTEALAAWPSMLNCPNDMPLNVKKICWQACACRQVEGKICVDSAPSDCKTKCFCSETAMVKAPHDSSADKDGQILLDDEVQELEL